MELSRAVVIATLALLLISLFATVPSVNAQAAGPVLPAAGDPILEFYLTGDALGGELTPAAPTGDKPIQKSVLPGPINPGLGTRVTLGTFQVPADFVFTGDAVVQLYLVSAQATAYDQIQAQISNGPGGSSKANAPTTLGANAIQTSVVVLRIPLPTRGVEFKADTVYALELILFGAAAPGTPTDLFLIWGAANRATGLSGAVDNAAAVTTGATAFPVFIDNRALTTTTPTGTEDKRTAMPTSCTTGPCMGSSASAAWGETVATQGFTVTGETVLTIYVGPPSTGAARGFGATLTLGDSTLAGNAQGTFAHTWPSTAGSSAPRIYRFAFGTRGIEVEAGDVIRLSFQLWSTADTPAGAFQMVYGSTGRPAGLVIPIAGGAAAASDEPQVVLSSEESSLRGVAGETVQSSVYLSNAGASEATVLLSASGNATVEFSDGETVTVGAGNVTQVNFTVAVPDAPAGASFDFSIIASIADVEVGNLSFMLEVDEAPQSTSSPTTSSAAPASTTSASSTNETARLKTQEPPVVIPGATAWAALIAALVVVTGRRLRRGE